MSGGNCRRTASLKTEEGTMKTLHILCASALLASAPALADNGNHNGNGSPHVRHYEITITNITSGQSFTPILVATHTAGLAFFEAGATPSQALADMAEGGDTSGLSAMLNAMPGYALDQANTSGGLIGPGESRTVMITGTRDFDHFSLAGMLLPTNDSFVAINAMELPRTWASSYAMAWDAGSEDNDESCASIPGPQCGGMGEPFSDGLGEGFVHISRGIAGHGDLAPEDYDWRNPVALVTVKRLP
jgi:hypothetical protein